MGVKIQPFVPLDQLGKYLASESTADVLERARALYDSEPTRAHYENLQEAKAEHKLALNRRSRGFREKRGTRGNGASREAITARPKAITADIPLRGHQQ